MHPFQFRNLLPMGTLLILICASLIQNAFAVQTTDAEQLKFSRSSSEYSVPDVMLRDQTGKQLSLVEVLDDGRPVILNFVFASCAAVCPMLSHVFAQTQKRLDQTKQSYHLVSISIDPENDTPVVLTEYAHKFNAGKQWDFYTGSLADSISVQKAFDAYRGDKMNHPALAFIRNAKGQPWIRLEGFFNAKDLLREYHR